MRYARNKTMGMITDKKLKFLNVKSGFNEKKEHNDIIALLVKLLSKEGIILNYDHINTTVIKDKKIPMYITGKNRQSKADIAFFYINNTLIHIYVETFKHNAFKKSQKDPTTKTVLPTT